MKKVSNKETVEGLAQYYIHQSQNIICSLTDQSNFKLTYTKLDWSRRRSYSRGGWYSRQKGPGISIAMSGIYSHASRYLPKTSPYKVYEYQSFDKDPVIGGFLTNNTELHLALVITHEMAHAAQYYRKYKLNKSPGKPHGDIWKKIYSVLREELVNPFIPDQKKMKEEMDEIIEKMKKQELGSYVSY